MLRSLLIASAFLFIGSPAFAADPTDGHPRINLWPGPAPMAKGTAPEDIPWMAVYAPPEGQANGCSILVCPGGGYGGLAKSHEGDDIGKWLNSLGVTAYILNYRLGQKYGHPVPLTDAQRAIRTIRHDAAENKLDPHRIGILGFSAGGHLSSTVITHFDAGNPQAEDPIDRESSRPDFAVLCYGVLSMQDGVTHEGSKRNLLGAAPDPKLVELLSNEKQVTPETPPTFLFHTTTDTAVLPENSLLFYAALRKAKVPAELHIYQKGPHGIGLSRGEPSARLWPEECANWMTINGWIPAAKK